MDRIIEFLYWYCTDFCINMANILGVSYVEFNIWLFLISTPLALLVLFLLNINKYFFKPIICKLITVYKKIIAK
jgi:hypothetical protein